MFHPHAPGLLRDVVIHLLAQLIVKWGLIQPRHLSLELHAINRVRHNSPQKYEIPRRIRRNFYLTSDASGSQPGSRSGGGKPETSSRTHCSRTQRRPIQPTIPHIATNGIKLAIPRNPSNFPKLNAPYPLPASEASNIDSRFIAICPLQKAGHEECAIGQLSCIASCDDVETTITVTNTLQLATAISTQRHPRGARVQATPSPKESNGMQGPAYRGPNARPAFHQ